MLRGRIHVPTGRANELDRARGRLAEARLSWAFESEGRGGHWSCPGVVRWVERIDYRLLDYG